MFVAWNLASHGSRETLDQNDPLRHFVTGQKIPLQSGKAALTGAVCVLY